MSELSPATNFKFGFSFPDPEADVDLVDYDDVVEEYEASLITDIEKAEVMAYAGRQFEEAAALYRKVATAALYRIGGFESGVSNDRSFVNHHAQYHTFKAQHYANLALESSNAAEVVYTNADSLYDMIQASKTDGLVYDFDEVDDQDEDLGSQFQLELPLEIDQAAAAVSEEFARYFNQ